MLRIALRVLIAIGLILQGMAGATAADAMTKHHCNMSTHHDGGAPKCPCCPAKSAMTCADLCATIAAMPDVVQLPVVPIAPARYAVERPNLVAGSVDTPLRPPIA